MQIKFIKINTHIMGRSHAPVGENKPGAAVGVSEIPDQSPFLHEYAQQHPRAD